MTTRRSIYLLCLILIIAGFFRLYHLTVTPPGLYPDEAMNGNNAAQALQTGDYKVFYPENNGREGLFMDIQALFLNYYHANEPWVLRLPSAIFGILTVLGIYFLARELFSVPVGLLSSFLLATSFWHIMFSRIGFRAIMAPFFLVWAMYFLLKAFRSGTSTNYKLPATYSIIGGIFYGLGFYSYIAYRITPLLLLLFIPFFGVKNGSTQLTTRGFWKSTAAFLLTTFIVALPIGIYFLQHPGDFMGRTSELSIFASQTPLKDFLTNTVKTLGMFNFTGDWNWRQNYAGAPELFWLVGLLFLLGVVLAVKNLATSYKLPTTNYKFSYWFLFLWFFLAMLPVVISDEGIPHALRSILLIPPVMIFSGIGGVWLYDWIKKYFSRRTMVAATAFFAALLIANAYSMYFVKWANNPNVQGAFAVNYVEIGRQINALPASTPKYVVVQAGGVPVNGIPMPAQTVMFITGTFTKEGQQAKNVHYVLPADKNSIPKGAETFVIK